MTKTGDDWEDELMAEIEGEETKGPTDQRRERKKSSSALAATLEALQQQIDDLRKAQKGFQEGGKHGSKTSEDVPAQIAGLVTKHERRCEELDKARKQGDTQLDQKLDGFKAEVRGGMAKFRAMLSVCKVPDVRELQAKMVQIDAFMEKVKLYNPQVPNKADAQPKEQNLDFLRSIGADIEKKLSRELGAMISVALNKRDLTLKEHARLENLVTNQASVIQVLHKKVSQLEKHVEHLNGMTRNNETEKKVASQNLVLNRPGSRKGKQLLDAQSNLLVELKAQINQMRKEELNFRNEYKSSGQMIGELQVRVEQIGNMKERQIGELKERVEQIGVLKEKVEEISELKGTVEQIGELKRRVEQIEQVDGIGELREKVEEIGELKERVQQIEANKMSLKAGPTYDEDELEEDPFIVNNLISRRCSSEIDQEYVREDPNHMDVLRQIEEKIHMFEAENDRLGAAFTAHAEDLKTGLEDKILEQSELLADLKQKMDGLGVTNSQRRRDVPNLDSLSIDKEGVRASDSDFDEQEFTSLTSLVSLDDGNGNTLVALNQRMKQLELDGKTFAAALSLETKEREKLEILLGDDLAQQKEQNQRVLLELQGSLDNAQQEILRLDQLCNDLMRNSSDSVVEEFRERIEQIESESQQLLVSNKSTEEAVQSLQDRLEQMDVDRQMTSMYEDKPTSPKSEERLKEVQQKLKQIEAAVNLESQERERFEIILKEEFYQERSDLEKIMSQLQKDRIKLDEELSRLSSTAGNLMIESKDKLIMSLTERIEQVCYETEQLRFDTENIDKVLKGLQVSVDDTKQATGISRDVEIGHPPERRSTQASENALNHDVPERKSMAIWPEEVGSKATTSESLNEGAKTDEEIARLGILVERLRMEFEAQMAAARLEQIDHEIEQLRVANRTKESLLEALESKIGHLESHRLVERVDVTEEALTIASKDREQLVLLLEELSQGKIRTDRMLSEFQADRKRADKESAKLYEVLGDLEIESTQNLLKEMKEKVDMLGRDNLNFRTETKNASDLLRTMQNKLEEIENEKQNADNENAEPKIDQTVVTELKSQIEKIEAALRSECLEREEIDKRNDGRTAILESKLEAENKRIEELNNQIEHIGVAFKSECREREQCEKKNLDRAEKFESQLHAEYTRLASEVEARKKFCDEMGDQMLKLKEAVDLECQEREKAAAVSRVHSDDIESKLQAAQRRTESETEQRMLQFTELKQNMDQMSSESEDLLLEVKNAALSLKVLQDNFQALERGVSSKIVDDAVLDQVRDSIGNLETAFKAECSECNQLCKANAAEVTALGGRLDQVHAELQEDCQKILEAKLQKLEGCWQVQSQDYQSIAKAVQDLQNDMHHSEEDGQKIKEIEEALSTECKVRTQMLVDQEESHRRLELVCESVRDSVRSQSVRLEEMLMSAVKDRIDASSEFKATLDSMGLECQELRKVSVNMQDELQSLGDKVRLFETDNGMQGATEAAKLQQSDIDRNSDIEKEIEELRLEVKNASLSLKALEEILQDLQRDVSAKMVDENYLSQIGGRIGNLETVLKEECSECSQLCKANAAEVAALGGRLDQVHQELQSDRSRLELNNEDCKKLLTALEEKLENLVEGGQLQSQDYQSIAKAVQDLQNEIHSEKEGPKIKEIEEALCNECKARTQMLVDQEESHRRLELVCESVRDSVRSESGRLEEMLRLEIQSLKDKVNSDKESQGISEDRVRTAGDANANATHMDGAANVNDCALITKSQPEGETESSGETEKVTACHKDGVDAEQTESNDPIETEESIFQNATAELVTPMSQDGQQTEDPHCQRKLSKSAENLHLAIRLTEMETLLATLSDNAENLNANLRSHENRLAKLEQQAPIRKISESNPRRISCELVPSVAEIRKVQQDSVESEEKESQEEPLVGGALANDNNASQGRDQEEASPDADSNGGEEGVGVTGTNPETQAEVTAKEVSESGTAVSDDPHDRSLPDSTTEAALKPVTDAVRDDLNTSAGNCSNDELNPSSSPAKGVEEFELLDLLGVEEEEQSEPEDVAPPQESPAAEAELAHMVTTPEHKVEEQSAGSEELRVRLHDRPGSGDYDSAAAERRANRDDMQQRIRAAAFLRTLDSTVAKTELMGQDLERRMDKLVTLMERRVDRQVSGLWTANDRTTAVAEKVGRGLRDLEAKVNYIGRHVKDLLDERRGSHAEVVFAPPRAAAEENSGPMPSEAGARWRWAAKLATGDPESQPPSRSASPSRFSGASGLVARLRRAASRTKLDPAAADEHAQHHPPTGEDGSRRSMDTGGRAKGPWNNFGASQGRRGGLGADSGATSPEHSELQSPAMTARSEGRSSPLASLVARGGAPTIGSGRWGKVRLGLSGGRFAAMKAEAGGDAGGGGGAPALAADVMDSIDSPAGFGPATPRSVHNGDDHRRGAGVVEPVEFEQSGKWRLGFRWAASIVGSRRQLFNAEGEGGGAGGLAGSGSAGPITEAPAGPSPQGLL